MVQVGDKIRITEMHGEPQYSGREGYVLEIGRDCDGETYYRGNWGGCNIYPARDTIEVLPTVGYTW